jgi:hypothetical protein
MTRAVYNLLDDVKGEAYVRLLHHALSDCDSFILVIRHSIDVNATAEAVLNRLEPSLISSEERSEWPGTQLFDSTALVNTYNLSPHTAADLAEVADGLFSWCQPELPEDLSLIRKDGDPWLVTIAHEEDAYMLLSGEESAALTESIPALSLRLNEDDGEKGEGWVA